MENKYCLASIEHGIQLHHLKYALRNDLYRGQFIYGDKYRLLAKYDTNLAKKKTTQNSLNVSYFLQVYVFCQKVNANLYSRAYFSLARNFMCVNLLLVYIKIKYKLFKTVEKNY